MSMGHEMEMDALVASAGRAEQRASDVAAGLWRRRDGSVVPVTSMSVGHIQNALAMMKRNGFTGQKTFEAYLRGPGPNGEMAQDAFDRELDEVLEKKVSPYVDLLEDELRRRGVTS